MNLRSITTAIATSVALLATTTTMWGHSHNHSPREIEGGIPRCDSA